MQFSDHPSEAFRPFLTWQNIIDWAQTHYRDRIFRKDEQIPARLQLLYLVNQGAVRLIGKVSDHKSYDLQVESTESPLDSDSVRRSH